VVFIANTQEGQKIVVEFTEAYNEIGHSLPASKNLPPALLSCDRSTFRDFILVTMGYVDGKRLFHSHPQATATKITEKVSEALKTLHENGLTFGALRSSNILITDQHHVQFVDIKWPEGVVPGGLLWFENDNKMLRMLELRE